MAHVRPRGDERAPGSLRGWSDLVTRLGGLPSPLLETAGLPPDALDDEDALIPARAGMQLLELAADTLACPDFALQLSLYQDVDAFGPLTAAMRNTPTVRGTLDLVSQWLFVHSAAVALSVELGTDHTAIAFDLLLDPLPLARQTTDMCLATCHRVFATVLGSTYRPISVWLPHAPVAPLTRYIQFFAATVHPESKRAQLVVPAWLLDARVPDADDDIRANALAYLRSRYPQPDDTLTERVRHLLFQTLGTPDADYLAVARSLSLHPRTMQRRLNVEGTSFVRIKDEVLRNTARRYLTESSMTISQLAQILGFSEVSAFTRACTRWFGAPPTQVRTHGADRVDWRREL